MKILKKLTAFFVMLGLLFGISPDITPNVSAYTLTKPDNYGNDIGTGKFIIVVDTTKNGKTNSKSFEIPTTEGGYNYTVEWGDGNIDTGVTGTKTHTYAKSGIYEIRISGDFPRIYFYKGSQNAKVDRFKLLDIKQWGNIEWENMRGAFFGCAYLEGSFTDSPNLSNVTDMSIMFEGTNSFNGNISNWNTENVTDMTSMFKYARNFNQNLEKWNTKNVTNMRLMFYGASKFNGKIGSWDTSKVKDMNYMFFKATNFNQAIGDWNTGNVTGMEKMFYEAKKFNQPIGNWNTENVKSIVEIFRRAESFNQDLENWNTEKITSMKGIFSEATNFNGKIGSWNTSKVKDMSSVFFNAVNFDQPIGNWNTENVENMIAMFRGSKSFNQDIGNWNTKNVKYMQIMFEGAYLFNQDIGNWNTENVQNMLMMFTSAENFNQPIGNWNTKNVKNMNNMFYGASSFNQDLSNWKILSVLDMNWIFGKDKLSTTNYDKLLISFLNQQPTGNINIRFHGGESTYCSEEAENAREKLISDYGWKITDGGRWCSPDGIYISNDKILENSTEVGILKVSNEVSDNSYTFSLVPLDGSEDNSFFNLTQSGNLSFKSSPDYENPVDNDKNNIYKIHVEVTDKKGFTFKKEINITVLDIDEEAPIITLIGENPTKAELGTSYSDEGATCKDNLDTTCIVESSGSVDFNSLGKYKITYLAKDKAGNKSKKSREILVIDTTPPTITLNGQESVDLEIGTNYIDLGAICNDLTSCNISSSGNVDTNKVGSYIITYTATDSSLNKSTKSRIINVIDKNAPKLTLKGETNLILEVGIDSYEEKGYDCEDISGICNVEIKGTVDTKKVGVYEIIYTATDGEGNKTIKKRIVDVRDTTAPQIELNGESEVNLTQGEDYNELGATCNDKTSCSVKITGEVKTDEIGEYTIAYQAIDIAGNLSNIIKRKVIVKKEDGGETNNNGSGGGGSSSIDNCPNGDNSGSYHDGKCENSNNNNNNGNSGNDENNKEPEVELNSASEDGNNGGEQENKDSEGDNDGGETTKKIDKSKNKEVINKIEKILNKGDLTKSGEEKLRKLVKRLDLTEQEKKELTEIIKKIKYSEKKKVEDYIKEENKGLYNSLFEKYPTTLPQTGVASQKNIKKKVGIVPKHLIKNIKIDLPNKKYFSLAGSKNTDLSFWLKSVVKEDRNRNMYIVLPSQGLVVPINKVSKESKEAQRFFKGNNENFWNYLRDGSVELPGTSLNDYGEVGNKVIAGHSSYWKNSKGRYKTHFQKIIETKKGQEIWIYKKNNNGKFERFVYKVEKSYNTSKNDIEVIKPEGGKTLTLLTCTPVGGIKGRWVVKSLFVDKD